MTRKLLPAEQSFIVAMLQLSPQKTALNNALRLFNVEEMNDGGMGSLKFLSAYTDRTFGSMLCSASFTDTDGVQVIATLNVDDKGNLYELDIWKTDFSPLCHPLSCDYKISENFV